MDIEIKDLEKLSNILFSHLKEKGIEKVELKHDYYWELFPEEQYKMVENPEIVSGQLCDDWDFLKGLLAGEDDPIIHCFVWLASLYRYIGAIVSEASEDGNCVYNFD